MKTKIHTRKGFTLVELLVAMAILALLAAITAPALRSAKDKANFATCTNNLKQMAIAVHMYLNDYDETFPPCLDYVSWRQPLTYVETGADLAFVLNDYVGANNGTGTNNMNSKIWVCPTAAKYGRKGDDSVSPQPFKLGNFGTPAGWGPKYNLTYRWNANTTRDGLAMNGAMTTRAYPQSAKGLKSPSKAALIWELPDYLSDPFQVTGFYELHGGANDRVNCLFVDGHVQIVKVIPGAWPPETLWWYVAYGPDQGWDGIGNDPVN